MDQLIPAGSACIRRGEDIDIPFGRLVMIILKIMVASIPAMIILYAAAAILGLLFVALVGGGAELFNHVKSH